MLISSSIPALVPFTIASIVLATSISGSSSAPPGALVGCFGHHDQADQDRRRRAEHGGDDEMRGGVGDERGQQRRIEHQHGAGDAGHAAGHDQEQLAARHLCQIRPHEQRRLDHAEEDVGGGRETDRAADAERTLQQPGHAADDRWQHAPIEQQRRQHAHDQHDRQRLERQDEVRAGRLQVEGQGSAADIAEHEGGAGPRSRRDRADRVVDGTEGMGDDRQLQQHEGGDEGRGEADRSLAQRHGAPILRQREGDQQQCENAECRLQAQHGVPKPSMIMAAPALQRQCRDRPETPQC
ncbi:hypothetical protein AB7M16_001299 [Bradyrhizobium sp. USDA 372]